VPLSGIYARPGAVMRMGAEMAIERINSQGGVKALGGAKLKLVLLDSGDTTEKAKNAAQRMVAQETDLVAALGLLSQLVHAGRHRGDRARQSCRC
jgi:branched-chain amino acid transport system substrate-binding protein